jgi:hypothetical protein
MIFMRRHIWPLLNKSHPIWIDAIALMDEISGFSNISPSQKKPT